MNFLHYLLQVNLYLVVFYGFYRLWLRDETFHHLNRLYLVASATLSFFIPVLHSDWVRGWFLTQEVSETIYTYYNPQAIIISAVQAQAPTFTWGYLCALVYICGIVFFVGKLTFKIAHLERFLRRKKSKNTKVAFSFFNFVSVSHDLENRATILAHERVHVRQLHSADVLLFELIAIFNWFNPIVYAYQQSIRNIHEFLADDVAARYEASKADYAMLLLSQQFGVQPLMLTSNFFDKISIKRRIQMLAKPQSNQKALLKYGFTVPIFIIMLIVSSAAVSEHKTIEKIEAVVSSNQPVFADNDQWINLSGATILSPKLMEALTHEKITVVGQVFDEKKQPLPGATIVVKNASKGTITDMNGQYKIADLSTESELVISFVGFDTKVIKLKELLKDNSQAITVMVELHKTNNSLSEIVVVGYAQSQVAVQPQPVPAPQQKDGVYMSVEQMPEFPGGMTELYKFLSRNIRYPRKAVERNTQGKVFASFIINEKGEISDIEVLRGIGNGCDEEAVRVVAQMPLWLPGKQNGKAVAVNYTLPISFVLEGKTTVTTQPDKNPLYVLDGKVVAPSEIKDLNPANIEKVEVLKGESAISEYGEKGKEGVVKITLKKGTVTTLNQSQDKKITITGSDDEIFTVVEKQPEYPGGMSAMFEFLKKNIKYPAEAVKNKTQGKVFLTFVVEKNGSLSNINVLKSLDNSCDAEAIRVISLMPQWIPGSQNGLFVRTKYTLPIDFKLK